MPLHKSVSHIGITTSILLALGSATAAYAADEPVDEPMRSGDTGVDTGVYLSDSAITVKVKAALISNKLSGISVTTNRGVVALSGSVAMEELRQQATKIASSIDGVKGVNIAGLSVEKKES
ncbi:MAG: BON domain-containing protein [Rugosibacter sp.]